LRIRPRGSGAALECEWALIDAETETARGEGPLRDAPTHASRVELVIPAADVLITRVQLPPSARRRAGATLAYAVEEQTLGDPEAQHVSWLGKDGAADVLSVVDRAGLQRWLDALEAAYGRPCAAYCETLLLPRPETGWSVAWSAEEGFVRSGELEGAAMDAGEADTPPLALQLLLEDAAARGSPPAAIAIYSSAPHALPSLEAWEQKLGVALYAAGAWDWRTAPAADRARIAQNHGGVRALSRVATRLRPAAWIAMIALALHGVALIADVSWLASEQRALRGYMEARFRAVFPEAVAVVDPALQMRRKLTEARHAVNQPDAADFIPMIEHVAAAAKEMPPGTLRLVTYDRGRLTLQLGAADEAAVQRLATRLRETGFRVEVSPASPRSAERALTLTAADA
jgi:general secretion pathway protein L